MTKLYSSIVVGLLTLLCYGMTAWAGLTSIHETKETKSIAPGVTWTHTQSLTEDGWLNIHVVKANIKKKGITVDTLINTDSIRNLKTVEDMAEKEGAIAAVNTSFFNWGTKGDKPYPDGPLMKDGKVVSLDSSYNMYSDSMATFSVLNNKKLDLSYWKPSIKLVSKTGKSVVVNQLNKISPERVGGYYSDWTVLTRQWGKKSIGKTETYPDMIEIVVVRDKVKSIRKGMGATKIPPKGYVLVTRANNEEWIQQNIQKGDKVRLHFDFNMDIEAVTMATTGSSILIQDGKIPQTFSYDQPKGRHPRTAIGFSKSGKTLFMVTVDGRSNGSIGMTQKELAEWMKRELKCYMAINLDGGGSTNMAVRKPGEANADVVNMPSDGRARGVLAGAGIFVPQTDDIPNSLVVSTTSNRLFANTSIPLQVAAIDRYMNLVTIDRSQLQYTVEGVEGAVENGKFIPKSAGTAKISVKYKDISGKVELSVMSQPAYLVTEPSTFSAKVGEMTKIKVFGVDEKGFRAEIDKEFWTMLESNGLVSLQNGELKAINHGEGIVRMGFGSAIGEMSLSIGSEATEVIDDFENNQHTNSVYPSSVQAFYENILPQDWKGGQVGKLKYSFTTTEGNRAAYLNFNNEGLTIAQGASSLSLWVNPEKATSAWLRAEFLDANGQKKVMDLARPMDFNGWRQLRIGLDGIALPASLKKIYVVQTNPVTEQGSLMLDTISVITAKKASPINILDNIQDKQLQNTLPANGNITRIGIFSSNLSLQELQGKLFGSKALPHVMELEVALNPVTSNIALQDKQTQSFILGKETFGIQEFENVSILYINTVKKGIRQTNVAQWKMLLSKLNSQDNKKILISISSKLEDFVDPLEAQLFANVLEESGKEIWVFYPNDKNISEMKNGIKWIGVNFTAPGKTADGLIETEGFYEICVDKNTMTYNFIGL